jgi:superfamily II RNA helicase
MPELGLLEAYTDINNLLKRGIAYHHAGMLPILREYVELCFQARLVKVRAGSTFSSGSRQGKSSAQRSLVVSGLFVLGCSNLLGSRPPPLIC